jgi:hypothetical protein
MTPWQRVFARFGMNKKAFAALIGRDRSKVHRHLADEAGLISGPDQVLLLNAARQVGIEIPPEDFLPTLPAANDDGTNGDDVPNGHAA